MGWVIAIAVLALLAVSWLFSADSRDNEDWKPLAGGVSAASHHLVRPFSASPGAGDQPGRRPSGDVGGPPPALRPPGRSTGP